MNAQEVSLTRRRIQAGFSRVVPSSTSIDRLRHVIS